MTVAIRMGRLVEKDGERMVVWDGGPQDDGCDPEREYPYLPYRLLATGDFEEWMHKCPKVADVFRAVGYGAGSYCCSNLAPRMNQIRALPVPLSRNRHRDRVRWLQFWAQRVWLEYGGDAMIEVSG